MPANLALLLCAERLTMLVGAQAVEIIIAAAIVLQLGATVVIVSTAAPPRRLLVAAGGFITTLWALLCGFLAIMATSGNWM